ncbi:hypothetical protein ABT337_20400 [Saccharopolyspora hirsuta]|uniref:hypothetical protein n=1 Tax=Saccharopolyspora hirsuta TaxID=1837 RepID=UPI00331A6411
MTTFEPTARSAICSAMDEPAGRSGTEQPGTKALLQSTSTLPRDHPASAPAADNTSGIALAGTATGTTEPNSTASANVPARDGRPIRSAIA